MSFQGIGAKRVLIVSKRDSDNHHWMMERTIKRSGTIKESDFYFASLQTPNLYQNIVAQDIKVIVGMGDDVLQNLLGEENIVRWRGRVVDWNGRYFIPTFAPHKLLPQNPNQNPFAIKRDEDKLTNRPRFTGTWMLDMNYAIHVAKHGFKRRVPAYIVDPSPEEFAQWAARYEAALANDPDIYLSWDIETPYKQKNKNEDEFEEAEFDRTILRVSFAYEEYTGVSVPWSTGYLDTIQRLLASSGGKVVWNGTTFDVPVVESVGIEVRGTVYDYMDGWHLYQSDLPKGLEWVTSFTSDLLPWKHLNNSDPGIYSAIDADAALRNANWLRRKLKQTGQWTTFMNHVVRLMPVMRAAGKRGNYIDIPYRDQLREEFGALLAEKIRDIQPFVPREVKPRKVWLNPPVEGWAKLAYPVGDESGLRTTQLTHEGRDFDMVPVIDDVKVCSACNTIATNKSEHYANSKGEQKRDKDGNLRFGKNGNPLYESIPNPCKEKAGEIQIVNGIRFEYHEVLDFNPNSSEQMKAYARHFGHPIGENKRDASKEAFDKDHLKTLIKAYGHKHPLYSAAADIAKLTKSLGTYVYDADEFNLIHTTYKNAPSTPRFSSANVNLQNVGKREDNPYATKARKQIIARPGHRFVQSDSSAIEALVQGWWMNDPVYMELATQSVHAWVVAKKHGIDWVGDEAQVSYLKKNFKDDYDKMKTTNYLTNFGGGDYLLWKSFPEQFPTRNDAKAAQDMLYAMLPKLKEFHFWLRQKAHKESYLQLPGWNYRHYYYDIYRGLDPKTGLPKLAGDAKRACAFFPQGCAAAFMRDNILLLAFGDEACEWLDIEPLGISRGWLEFMPANLVVHDGYTLEVLDGLEWQAAEDLKKVLTRPIPQLAGLRVGCETDISEVGGNWAPYDKVKNPMGLKTVETVRVEVIPPPAGIRLAA